MHDIREYYLEAFEMRRLSSAVVRDRGGIAIPKGTVEGCHPVRPLRS